MELSRTTELLAGVLLLSLVTVETGGALLVRIHTGRQAATSAQVSLFRAGHAHAAVLLVLGLVVQLYVDAVAPPAAVGAIARLGAPLAAILIPAGFFLSVLRPGSQRPGRWLALVWVGAVVLAVGLVAAGVALLVG